MYLHSTEHLFSTSLIPSSIQSLLPTGYTFRSLCRSDYNKGHLDVLGDLAHIGDISEEAWIERFDFMAKCQGTYYVLVIEKTKDGEETRIVGTGTLVVERKLLAQISFLYVLKGGEANEGVRLMKG
jgi:glucosamine-phosphate N-acetyltransferase